MPTNHRQHGFTLIEQVTALAVAAILIAIAVPSMAHLVATSATRASEDALFNAAHLARTQAIMHDTHALLCPSRDGRHCDASAHWQQGWIVGLDRNHDHQPDAAVLARGRPDPKQVRLIGSRGRPRVRFRGDGAAAGTNLTLLICPRRADSGHARTLVISNVGRIREAPAGPDRRARCHSSR